MNIANLFTFFVINHIFLLKSLRIPLGFRSQVGVKKLVSLRLYSTPPSTPPPRVGGQGEWEDWESSESMDEYDTGYDMLDMSASFRFLKELNEATEGKNVTSVTDLVNQATKKDTSQEKPTEESSSAGKMKTLTSFEPTFVPARVDGEGEWSDWENDASSDDDADYEDTPLSNTAPSSTSTTGSVVSTPTTTETDVTDSTSTYVRDNKEWEGWSEEAPYFDEDDVQDDEGNWGRADESEGAAKVLISTGESDLWSRNYDPMYLKMQEERKESSVGDSVSTSKAFEGSDVLKDKEGLSELIGKGGNGNENLLMMIWMDGKFDKLNEKLTQNELKISKMEQNMGSRSELGLKNEDFKNSLALFFAGAFFSLLLQKL